MIGLIRGKLEEWALRKLIMPAIKSLIGDLEVPASQITSEIHHAMKVAMMDFLRGCPIWRASTVSGFTFFLTLIPADDLWSCIEHRFVKALTTDPQRNIVVSNLGMHRVNALAQSVGSRVLWWFLRSSNNRNSKYKVPGGRKHYLAFRRQAMLVQLPPDFAQRQVHVVPFAYDQSLMAALTGRQINLAEYRKRVEARISVAVRNSSLRWDPSRITDWPC